jgi:hypothetical protein
LKETGKALQTIVDLNDMACGELILLMNISKLGGLVTIGIIKASKSRDYEEGDGCVAWTHLVNNYAPRSAPTMIKLETEF